MVCKISIKEIKSFDNLLSKAQELRGEGNIVSVEIKSKNLALQLDKLVEQGFNSFAIFEEAKEIEVKGLGKKK